MQLAPSNEEMPDFSLANCRGKPVEWWYPVNHMTREGRVFIKSAIQTCRDCQIQTDCLKYSLVWEPVGIWGGHQEAERHGMRKEQQIMCNRPVGGVKTKAFLK